ncbi:hypothetical protein J2790_003920 [Paenarthrobacter nicotinovorans]|uniref:hypothetical protein n=1 Tax=Micrococcaceae TaxID=1268 RepID=UPI0008771696|nr:MULTISPECIES: hypothetical protein [Micrococcaceae]MDR6438753.1 hypothetical protein [Paenarthrobacter nicotinovorans]SCZ56397.1 hypothetical protein SAMN02799638_01818 [Arthrobacter sp. UNCCL28]
MLIDASVYKLTEDTIRSLNLIRTNWNNDVSGQIVAVASRVEALVDRFIDLLVSESQVDSTPLGRALLKENNGAFHQSWPARNAVLKNGFDVQLASMPMWADMDLVIDIRNAIVHGDGNLTDRQAKDIASLINMRKRVAKVLHSEIQGRVVRLSPESGSLSAEIGVKFVLAADAAVSSVRPALDP